MAESKTKPTDASVIEYIASRAKGNQADDCKALTTMLQRVTGAQPKMWGPSIVGFGSYKYRYESGRSGESCLTGFAIRGADLVVYLMAEGNDQAELLAKLGKHKLGKACLYFKRLSDIDQRILEQLVVNSVSKIKCKHHPAGAANTP